MRENWQPEINEIKHRIELIAGRDGSFDPLGDLMDSLLSYGFGMAEQEGIDAAIRATTNLASGFGEESREYRVLMLLASKLRNY